MGEEDGFFEGVYHKPGRVGLPAGVGRAQHDL